MAVFTRTTKNLIIKIDEFFDDIDLGLLVFREGIKAYLEKDMEGFQRHLLKVDQLENNADRLQREIENEMITHSILPQHRSEVSALIDELDEIITAPLHAALTRAFLPGMLHRGTGAIVNVTLSAPFFLGLGQPGVLPFAGECADCTKQCEQI